MRYVFIAAYASLLINSHNQLLLHSFIMRHPWRYSKFYQVGHLSPPFHSLLYNECYLLSSTDLSGSVFQLQYLNPNYEILSFVFWVQCVRTANLILSSSSENLPLVFFFKDQNLGGLVLKCAYLFPQSLQEHVEWEWFLHTNSWLCFCYALLSVFILHAWFWQLYDITM